MQSDKFCRSNRPAYKKYPPINYLKVMGTKFSVHSVKGVWGVFAESFFVPNLSELRVVNSHFITNRVLENAHK